MKRIEKEIKRGVPKLAGAAAEAECALVATSLQSQKSLLWPRQLRLGGASTWTAFGGER